MKTISARKRTNRSCIIVLLILIAGCRSSSYAQRGRPPAVTGPPMGASLDDIDARNRADISAQLGRPVAPGPATPAEVVAMTRAGVDPRFIIGYINRSTSMDPITAQDVIELHNQGVNEQVIQAMLTPGSGYTRSEVARTMPQRVYIIEDPYWPYYYPHYGFAYGYGWGHHCY